MSRLMLMMALCKLSGPHLETGLENIENKLGTTMHTRHSSPPKAVIGTTNAELLRSPETTSESHPVAKQRRS